MSFLRDRAARARRAAVRMASLRAVMRPTALGLGALALVSCAELADSGTYGSATTQRALETEFPGVEVKWLGSVDRLWADRGEQAALTALRRLERAGVAPERIEWVTIDGWVNDSDSDFPRMGSTKPAYYDLWAKVTGCEKYFQMKATFTGRLVWFDDRGDCLVASRGN